MSEKYFQLDGRCATNLTKHKVYSKSRKYFELDKDRVKNISIDKIYDNYKKFLNIDPKLSNERFGKEISEIKQKLQNNQDHKNILNGISIPFILPKNDQDDIGENLQKIYLPALKKAFSDVFSNYEFINHCKQDLKNKIKLWNNTRNEKILKKLKSEDVVGLLFPCLNEFSFPAAIETLNNLPDCFLLAGAYEVIASLIGYPALLRRDKGYPPLLWFSSLRNSENSNISYHLEPYGYNLTFNKRAHLNLAAEYWWHSLVVVKQK